MFDLAFSELLIIGLVALIVIGPERLPKVARTAGQWLGRLNRYVSQVKQDIDRDMKLEELRKMQEEMKATAQRFEIMANDTAREVETTVSQETAQISKVMQAMSVTDNGLTRNEWEKLVAEQQADPAKTPAASDPASGGQALTAPAEVASSAAAAAGLAPADGVVEAHAAEAPVVPDAPVVPGSSPSADANRPRTATPARPATDYPDGSVG